MTIYHNTHPIADRDHAATDGVSIIEQVLQAIARAFRRFYNRRKVRRMLDLSPHLLDDIGLTHTDVVDAVCTGRGDDPIELLNARRRERIAELTATPHKRRA